MTVDGFNKTGLPSAFWNFMEPHAQIDRVSGTVVLALVILYLSNLASNVPTGIDYFSSHCCLLSIFYLFPFPLLNVDSLHRIKIPI